MHDLLNKKNTYTKLHICISAFLRIFPLWMTEATSTWEISVYHYDMFHQQQNSQVRYLLTIPSRYIRHVLSEVTPEELEIHFFVAQWSM